MNKMTEMNRLQQEAQRLREKEIQINDLLEPHQEQITELVDAVEQKFGEFTATRNEVDAVEDSGISQAMLDSAKEHAAAMENEVVGLRDKLQRTSQESKEKLHQEKPIGSGSGTSHK